MGTLGLSAAVAINAARANQETALARLALNENPFGPSQSVIAAIAAESGRLHRYLDQSEVDRFATQIARFEGVEPSQVVVGEVLDELGRFFAAQHGPGSEVVYSSPGYTALADAAAAFGGRGVPVPLDAQLRNDLKRLQSAVSDKTSVVFVVNPHNPSGTLSEAAAFSSFLTETSRKALVIVDEAYLEYDDFAALSAANALRRGVNVLVFRTFAKIYGLGGLYVGYALAPPQVASQLRSAGLGSARSLNRLAVVAAEAALADQPYIAQVKKQTVEGRNVITAALDRLKLRHTDSRANFVFFESPKPYEDVRSQLFDAGIVIGRSFPPLDKWVRITIGTPAENARVIKALEQLFRA
jgi:histidinol-phosphate aminotransferase